MRTTNRAGRTYSFMSLAPIRDGEEDALRAFLASMPGDDSPFARFGRTHLARLLIVPDMPFPPGREDLADPMGGAYLLLTSNFDGGLDSYLGELVAAFEPEAGEIWGRCIGCPQPAAGAALKAYIGRNQIDSGVVFAAYGDAPLERVRSALDARARLEDFVLRTQDMTPARRRKAFLKEFGP